MTGPTVGFSRGLDATLIQLDLELVKHSFRFFSAELLEHPVPQRRVPDVLLVHLGHLIEKLLRRWTTRQQRMQSFVVWP